MAYTPSSSHLSSTRLMSASDRVCPVGLLGRSIYTRLVSALMASTRSDTSMRQPSSRRAGMPTYRMAIMREYSTISVKEGRKPTTSAPFLARMLHSRYSADTLPSVSTMFSGSMKA